MYCLFIYNLFNEACLSKMDPGEIAWGGMDWIDLTQDRNQWSALVNKVTKLWVP
jgi:hypothetical protein